jgi:lauroyl/myristoyl acyltransferase
MPAARRGVRTVLWLANLHRRLLGVVFAVVGPRVAYAVTGAFARLIYWLLPPLRMRSEAQCRAALAGRVPPQDLSRIARQSWVHGVWNVTDLLLAERLLHPGTYARYGGRVPEPHLSTLLAAQQRRQPVILLSAYYGPVDLLPVFLGYNGVRAAVLYQRHPNAAFNAERRRVRARSGCELVLVEQAIERLPRVLEAGGTLAVVADHYAERRGVTVTFLGLPTTAVRTVGVLACRYNAGIVVAGIRRLGEAFRFEIDVADVIVPADWAGATDAVAYITHRYVQALERLVLRDPTQYPWLHARWGEELARRLTQTAEAG